MKPIKRLFDYLRADLWRIRLSDQSRRRGVLIRMLRVIVLSFRGFNEDKCMLRASALTFFTLMSIVPVLALAFGIAKAFNFEELLRTKILEMAEGQQEALERIIAFADQMLNTLEDTSGGAIAGVGILLLFWSVIKLLGNIEGSFNDIWGIKTPRSWGQKFIDYLFFMVATPVIFIITSSMTVAVTTKAQEIVERLDFLGVFAPIIIGSLRIVPFIALWGLFLTLYLFMPNTRVRFRSAIVAAIVAGTLFQMLQWFLVTAQVGAAKAGAVYGSFAALPLFLVWLQLSWFVVLYGAELAFAVQHVDTYEFEPDCLTASRAVRRKIALGIVHHCISEFKKAEKPSTADEISKLLEAPSRLVNEILHELVEANVLSEVVINRYRETGYQPAQAIENLTIESVLRMLDEHGNAQVPFHPTPAMDKIQKNLVQMGDALKNSQGNSPLGKL